MKPKIFNRAAVLFSFLLLAACAEKISQSQSDNLFYFGKTYYVVEKQSWGSKSIVLRPAYETQGFPIPVPPFSKYAQNKQAWLAWHRMPIYHDVKKFRILGSVDSHTRYRMDKKVVWAFSGMLERDITIMTGPLAGTHVKGF